MRFPGLATLAVVALCACGGGGDGGPHASSIALSAGDNQVAAAGAALPESLAVIVRDNAGAALPGVAVTWSVTAGGGSVSPTTRTSDASGIAKTRRTLGPNAGTQTARATVSGLSPVNFSAISQIQGAVNIANATTGLLTDTAVPAGDRTAARVRNDLGRAGSSPRVPIIQGLRHLGVPDQGSPRQ